MSIIDKVKEVAMHQFIEVIEWLDNTGDTMVYKLRAIRCLDSSKIAPTAAEDVADKRAVLLSEIFDRIQLPDPKTVPDAEDSQPTRMLRPVSSPSKRQITGAFSRCDRCRCQRHTRTRSSRRQPQVAN